MTITVLFYPDELKALVRNLYGEKYKDNDFRAGNQRLTKAWKEYLRWEEAKKNQSFSHDLPLKFDK